MFHASYAATVTPRTGFMLSIPCVMPMVRTSFPPSWPDAVLPPGNATIAAASTAATKNPPMAFTLTLLKACGCRSFPIPRLSPSDLLYNFVQRKRHIRYQSRKRSSRR